jgi:hypothetical protein
VHKFAVARHAWARRSPPPKVIEHLVESVIARWRHDVLNEVRI